MKLSRPALLLGALSLAITLFAAQPVLAHDSGITAREVLDRETLKAFVRSAKAYVAGITDPAQIDELLNEQWKFGSVYVYISNAEGIIRWHGANTDLVGQDLTAVKDPITGALFVQELLAAARSGGGYVKYHFDDPVVIGDEDLTSPKLGYVEPFPSPLPDLFPEENMIMGSGIYLGHQVALDFAHFGNGSAISSDIVLVNLAATPIRPAVYFYDKAGELIDPASVVDIGDNLEATDYGAVTLHSELAPLGEVTISTNGRGDTVTGSVKVISDGPHSPIGGVLRFDVPGVGVAGVGASQAVRNAIFPARRRAGGIDTGAALRNLSEKELTLTLQPDDGRRGVGRDSGRAAGGQRTGRQIHQRVVRDRHLELHGIGALHGAGNRSEVHGSRGGIGWHERHLHHAAGDSPGGPNAFDGGNGVRIGGDC